jgi:4-diphosphocytidyl-2-C-methyl-D-erythritol kinase
MRLFSPAKINLFLRVMRCREDGYHDLASLFQAISLGDFITLHLTGSEDQLTCTDPSLPCNSTNLILKAIALFRKKTGLTFSIQAHLEKHIPVQSGLGGGSSNAATTLWGINQLLGCPATEKELKIWAAEIGSDIPFFFSSGTAYCTGRGEDVVSLHPLNLKRKLWIVKPPYGLSTKVVFKYLDIHHCSNINPEILLASFYQGNFHLINDLEDPAFFMLPRLKDLKKNLCRHGLSVLTGSGTALLFFGDPLPQIPHVQASCAFFVQRERNWYDAFKKN